VEERGGRGEGTLFDGGGRIGERLFETCIPFRRMWPALCISSEGMGMPGGGTYVGGFCFFEHLVLFSQ
jgi:hypothetical protein